MNEAVNKIQTKANKKYHTKITLKTSSKLK
jgi:hypothetical protein